MKETVYLLQEKYHGKQSANYFRDIKRLEIGEPLAYVIGNIPFLNTSIDLSFHPLIPRTETEYWVKHAIKVIKKETQNIKDIKFLDLFSGSGCIGVALLKNFPDASVHFGEKDNNLINQIKGNINGNGLVEKNYQIFETDVFENVFGQYDYIFANPPYIDENRRNDVEESVTKFEPREALFAQNHGLFYIEKLIKESKSYLNKNGSLFIECDDWQKEKIEEYLQRHKNKYFEFLRDQYDCWRVLILHNSSI